MKICNHETKADARMWDSVDMTGSCWMWKGSMRANGYGYFTRGNRGSTVAIAAHRAAYFLSRGPIPDGMLVCHTCDVRACVNPDHLFVGSHRDNSIDAAIKGRNSRVGKSRLTHCKHGHDLALAYVRKNGHRECRLCQRNRTEATTLARRSRAAEAKASRGGDHVADAGQMVAAAQEPKP